MYSEYMRHFPQDVDRKIRCLAARWMLGVEDMESLAAMTKHNYVIDKEPDYMRTVYQKPVITLAERDEILKLAGWRM